MIDPFAPPSPLTGFTLPIGVKIPFGHVLSLSGGRTTNLSRLGTSFKSSDKFISNDLLGQIYEPRISRTVSDVHGLVSKQGYSDKFKSDSGTHTHTYILDIGLN